MEKFVKLWHTFGVLMPSYSVPITSACMWRLLIYSPYLVLEHWGINCFLLFTTFLSAIADSLYSFCGFRTLAKVPFVVNSNNNDNNNNNNNNNGEEEGDMANNNVNNNVRRRARILIHDNEIEGGGGESIRKLDDRDHRIPQVNNMFLVNFKRIVVFLCGNVAGAGLDG